MAPGIQERSYVFLVLKKKMSKFLFLSSILCPFVVIVLCMEVFVTLSDALVKLAEKLAWL